MGAGAGGEAPVGFKPEGAVLRVNRLIIENLACRKPLAAVDPKKLPILRWP
jgi:hypothetical protein